MKRFLFFIRKIFYLLGFLLISCTCCNLFDDLENDFNNVKSKLEIKEEVVLSELKILGEGHWGKVFKINKDSCLKTIKNENNLNLLGPSDIKNGNNIPEIKEFIISDTLKDKKIKGIQEIEKTIFSDDYIFIKSKFYKGPTLEKYIEEKKGYEKENKIKLVLKDFLQIVTALKNLHELNFVHLDLKSDNLIFTDEDCKELIIIDLGTARTEDENNELLKEQTEILGTKRNYSYNVAQSIINEKGYSGKKYDIWCLGLILYHMYFGEELFPRYNFANILNAGLSFGSNLKYVENVLKDRENFDITQDSNVKTLDSNSSIYNLLTHILTKEDKYRWSLDDIIKEIEKVIPPLKDEK